MKSFVALATLLSVAQSIAALTINTPTNVVACQPILLTWTDGTAPYYLSVIPGGQVSAPALKTFPTQNGNQLTWVVDLQANTGITIACKDSTGAQAYTDIVTINSGSDTNCLNSNSNSTSTDVSSGPAATGANSGASSSTTGAAGATTTGGAAPSATNSNAAGGSKTTAASTATKTNANSASSSTHSNAASKSDIGTFGIAGVMALVGLAVV